MVFNNKKIASFRVVLIIVLIMAMYGLIPVEASAQTSAELASQSNDCYPGSGWMWAAGPSEPDLASQAQEELARQGIQALVEANGYGETDNCGTFNPHGVDFSIKFLETQSKQWSSQEALNDAVLSVLSKYGKPDLGLVKLNSSDGQLISNNINQKNSTSKETGLDTFSAEALVGNPVTKNVYVIVYDPLLGNGQRLSQRMGWSDHATVTQQTVDFFNQAVNKINYVVVQTTVVTSGWPELVDGFRYTEEEFLAVVNKQQTPHEPMGVDYNKILNSPQFDICGKVNRGEIDELWIYNGPYFGFYESTLVGPGAYKFNSPPVGGIHNCNRLLPIMGPSLERTVHEAVHNFGHRGEDTMAKVYGSWQQNNTSHNWNKFALVKVQSPNYSYSGCGSIHFPPNGTFLDGLGYDYSNPSDVLSNCDDFANYPNLSDPSQVAQPVNCSRWGCDQLGYLGYWFGHFPSFTGCGPDNVANDWWKYFANPVYALYPANACQPDMHIISGNVGAPGALLSYTDGVAKTVTADANGNYFLMVSNNWSGIVTPSRFGYTFTPANRTYTDVITDLYNQNYTPQGGGPLTFYVNIAAGNNSNTCISTAAPCRDIQEAINKANAGDTIKVANGRYLFSSNPSPNVAIIDKNLTLSGGWNADFTSQSSASTIDGANINNGILIISGTVTVENFIVENSISSNSGAIYIVNGSLTLRKSTLRNNVATNNGAGIFVDNGTVNVINSTISGNRANGSGGGIYAANIGGASVNIQNSTIAFNQAARGGGISRITGSYNLTNTIVANNTSSVSSPDCEGTIAVARYSLIENMSGCTITSATSNLHVNPQLDSAWTGAMSVHMPLSNSPVIDAGTATGCPATDQVGTTRPFSTSCDIGAVEYVGVINTPTHTPTFTPTNTLTPTSTFTATPSTNDNPLYISLTNSQMIGGISSSDEDILRFNGSAWSLFFDGSDVGVGSPDLSAFSILDADTILMSFGANVTVNGITATPQDILRFDATSLGSTTSGTWSLYFDGSDVGFDDATNEKIDSLKLLPDGRLLLSTTGNPSVPGLTTGRDEDVLAFTPTTLGDITSGTWSMYFDGSDVGLSETSGEDIDALDMVGNTIYLSTQDVFSVPGVSGEDDDVFICSATSIGDVTACNYSPTLYFDGSTWGLTVNDVDAFNFLDPGSIPTAVPTNTPTATQTPTTTSTSGSGSTLTFTAIADARVVQTSPTTNYGTATTLQADGDSSAAQTSFIRFNASGIGGPIQSAKLRVFCTTNGTANGPAAYLSHNNWSESGPGGITWNTQPPLLSGAFDNKGSIAANSWVEYDVTALVTTNGIYSFALVADSGDGIVFSSREGATPPQLVVTLGVGPSTSTPVTNTPTFTPTYTPTPTATAGIDPTSTNTPTPTATQTTGGLFTFTSIADAYVDANNPGTNYGGLTTLRADGSPIIRSYLRFNVQGVDGTVTRATLRIFANSASSQGCAASSVSNDTWMESTLNFNNSPALDSPLGSSGSFGAGVWISIDVTAYVTGNGTYNLALTTPGSTAVSLASRESGVNAPQLIIEAAP